MNSTPYFPPLYGKVDCGQCEASSECWCSGKYQRDRRDFTHTSGRCPRLPDLRGFVDKSVRDLYARTIPLVSVERGEDALHLTLSIPGEKRTKKVYHTKSGYWYFRERDDSGRYASRVLSIECHCDAAEIIRHLNVLQTDYCLLRATIEDYFI